MTTATTVTFLSPPPLPLVLNLRARYQLVLLLLSDGRKKNVGGYSEGRQEEASRRTRESILSNMAIQTTQDGNGPGVALNKPNTGI